MNDEAKKNILLVEDELCIAMAEKGQLERFNYAVYHVDTGEKAIETIRDNIRPVDLILMDINLGSGIDGTGAAEQILAYRDIPVVFLSSHTEPEIVQKTEKITSYGYVVKNTDIVVLDTSIKMALKLFKAKMEQREAEKALRMREEEFHLLFKNSPYGIIICELIRDSKGEAVDFIHLQGNSSTEKQTGFIIDQLIGKRASELVDMDVLEELVERYSDVVESGKTIHYEEYFDLYKRYLMVIVYPISASRFVLNFIDITQRKEAEENIKMQLSEKETLLKEVHHRVKNNIANIEGLLLLQAYASENQEVKDSLNDAISRVKGMRILYDRLLLREGHSDVSIKNYVEKLIDSLEALFVVNGRITIEKEISDFIIDSRRAVPVGIIINEILTNSFKYAFNDPKRNGHVKISMQNNENQVTLVIHDNGPGFREDGSAPKSGLGLFIVKMLTEQLKGSYTVAEENGVKITFQFEM